MTTSSLAAVAAAAAAADQTMQRDEIEPPRNDMIAKTDHDAAVKAAHDQGVAAGAKAENARLLVIEANALPGHEDLVAAHKADMSMSPEASAMAILKAERANPRSARSTLEALDKAAEGVESRPSASGDAGTATPKATTPEGWKAEWEGSSKLQAEYPTADAYVAVKKREARAV